LPDDEELGDIHFGRQNGAKWLFLTKWKNFLLIGQKTCASLSG
jgi:hypothetical protein